MVCGPTIRKKLVELGTLVALLSHHASTSLTLIQAITIALVHYKGHKNIYCFIYSEGSFKGKQEPTPPLT